MNRNLAGFALGILLLAGPVTAQTIKHPDASLHSVFPAGGRQGQTLTVELGGVSGFEKATGVFLEGAPGITIREVKAVSYALVRATFVIAADAPPGKRLVRVLGGASGLTNARPFFVGRLPEIVEKEPNDTPAAAQEVAVPAVVNGRIERDLDVDCFAFQGKAGQRLVGAVLAHGMDSMIQGKRMNGYLDASLELLDGQGKVVAAAEDTLGLDPVIYYTVPADGRYTVRVSGLDFKGAPSAVYRLTLGEVPYPTHVFPPGGQRGQKTDVEFFGFNVPLGTRCTVMPPPGGTSPVDGVTLDHPLTDGREMPFVWGDYPERVEVEPNDEAGKATPLQVPMTVSGRFERLGDEDWYRVHLKNGQGILLDVTAQRHLRSPVDTLLEVYDASGKKLAENDDGELFLPQCAHDFAAGDSWLSFTAPAEGDYFLRLSEQSGASGPMALYRLSVSAFKPDFLLYQWPDAVPVWGPGGTACCIVQVMHWGGMSTDIKLRVEGLPPGWTGVAGLMPGNYYTAYGLKNGLQVLVSLTAPADAPLGAVAPFRVVGRAEQNGQVIEHVAQPLMLYGSGHSKRMHFRFSSQAHAVLAAPMDCWLETPVKELTVKAGETIKIPVKVHRHKDSKAPIAISIDGPTVAAGTGLRPPLTLAADQDEVELPLTMQTKLGLKPGTYGIVVCRAWTADIRGGRPGPCTPLILLHVLPGAELAATPVKGKTKGK